MVERLPQFFETRLQPALFELLHRMFIRQSGQRRCQFGKLIRLPVFSADRFENDRFDETGLAQAGA